MNIVAQVIARVAADPNTPMFKCPTENALKSVYLKRYRQQFRQEVETPSNFVPFEPSAPGAEEQAAPIDPPQWWIDIDAPEAA